MGRKKIYHTEEEIREYNAKRQREYYAKHRERLASRKLELYYENKDKKRDIRSKNKQQG